MSTVDKFSTEFKHFVNHLPECCKGAEVVDDNFLRITTKFGAPFAEILIHTEENYRKFYPHGAVAFLLKGENAPHAHGMPADAAPTLQKICATVEAMARVTMRGANSRDVAPPKSVAELFPLHEPPSSRDDQPQRRSGSGHDDEQQEAGMMARPSAMANREGSSGSSCPAVAASAAAASSRRSFREGSFWSGAASMSMTAEGSAVLDSLSSNPLLVEHIDAIERGVRLATAGSAKVTVDTSAIGMMASMHVCVPLGVMQSALTRRGDIGGAKLFSDMFASYGLDTQEHVIFKFVFDPVRYDSASAEGIKVDVGQPSHFATGSFPGAAGQLRRVVAEYVRKAQLAIIVHQQQKRTSLPDSSPSASATAVLREHVHVDLFRAGFNEVDISDAINTAFERHNNTQCKKGAAAATMTMTHAQLLDSARAVLKESDAEQLSGAVPDPLKEGPFFGAIMTFINRLKRLPDYCVICDRNHTLGSLAANRAMARAVAASPENRSSIHAAVASCCARAGCQMRYQELDVGRDIVTGIAISSGVTDLLLHTVKNAVFGRAQFGLNPWPLLVSASGQVVVNGTKNDNLALLQKIMTNFPIVADLVKMDSAGGGITAGLKKHHELAPQMFQWVSSSCASTIIRVPKTCVMPLMNTPFQFRVLCQSAEHNEKFEQLKKANGSFLTWHGAPCDMLWSILNGGLKNMSLNKDGSMLHGNACGGRGGIYQSNGFLSTSMGYSGVYAPTAHTVEPRDDAYLTPAAGAAANGQGIGAIFLCECIDHDFTSGNRTSGIVVQPNNSHVVLRALFAYTLPHVPPPGQSDINKINLLDKDIYSQFETWVNMF